jgi:CRP-like cAMP-binding protein
MSSFGHMKNKQLAKRSLSLKLSPQLFRRSSIVQEIEEECNMIENGLKKLTPVREKKCFISPNYTPKAIWDSFIFLLISYSVIVLPYNVTFQSDQEKELIWVAFDSTVDFVFFVDMLIFCFTGVYDNNSNVTAGFQIFVKYLKSWMIVDLISNFPYQIVEFQYQIHRMRYFRFLKTLRIHKISNKFHQIFELLNKITSISYLSENLILWFLVLCLFLHFTACLWSSVGEDETNFKTWITYYKIQDEDDSYKYLASIYWVSTTIFTVGFGDIIPVTDTEKIFAICTMGIGVFFFSYIISSISLSLNLQAKRNYHLEYNLRNLQLLNRKYKLPNNLYSRIEKHIKYNLENTRKDHKSFALSLTTRLSQQLIFIMHKKLVDENLFFQDKPEVLIRTVILHLMPIKFDMNEPIFWVGDVACEIYFIILGKVEYFNENGTFEVVDKGDYFGDAEIFHREYRDFNVKAVAKCEFLILDQVNLMKCMENFEDIKLQVISIAVEKWNYLQKRIEKIANKKKIYDRAREVEIKKYPSEVDYETNNH